MKKSNIQFDVNVSETEVWTFIAQIFDKNGQICSFEVKENKYIDDEDEDEDDDFGIGGLEITRLVTPFDDEFEVCKKAYEDHHA